jgi:hypothetical protein
MCNLNYSYKYLDYNSSINKNIKIGINMYLLILVLFNNTNIIDISNYKLNFLFDFYKNIPRFRLYYIFYYIKLEKNLDKYIWYINISSIENQKLYLMKYKIQYNYSNYIHIHLYLLSDKINLLWKENYSKFSFYNKLSSTKFFFLNEFKLKVDFSSFCIYGKYLEYYRNIKYYEYIKNHKILWNYKGLHKLLIIKQRKNVKHNEINFVSTILWKYYQIYKITCNTTFKIYKPKLILNYDNLKSRKYSDNVSKNLDGDEITISQIRNNKSLKFFDVINPFLNYKLYKIYNTILYIYIIHMSYIIYNKYIMLSKKLRKNKCIHILYLHYKYQNFQIKYINNIYVFYFMYLRGLVFMDSNTINYGFALFYYFEKRKYMDSLQKSQYYYIIY